MIDIFTLQDIANWQLNSEQQNVELPSIQRGFVWKSKQVEDLWDSILRGYPIGSFLFSKTGEKLYLMDGQQRATSIFLGHFNPFNPSAALNAWSIKGELPIVWIDLKPHSKPDISKYLIRLTTRSHPWGYKAENNNSILSVSDRREALTLFRKHGDNVKVGYTSFKNSTVFPYDANFPLPLCFFIESNNINDVIEKVERHLPDYFSTKHSEFKDKSEFLDLLNNDSNLREKLSEIFEAVKNAIKIEIKSNIIEHKVLTEENEQETPTLFVRINSSGTTLTGDDLIYSIYKATFPEAKELIENIGLNFIPPTQVISLVSRIVASDMEDNNYVKKMNIKDFQRRIKNNAFKENLKNLIENQEIERLFEQAINILACKDNSLFEGEMPPVIIKQFIKKNQELFLFFIYWLHINENYKLTEQIKLKIVAKLLSLAWFGSNNIQELWNDKIKNATFWEEPLNELIWGEVGLHFLIKPDLLRKYYLQPEVESMFLEAHEHRWGLLEEGIGKKMMQYYSSVKSQEFVLGKTNDFFWEFIEKIRFNKQLILFAQRAYINSTFADYNQIENIEDTNAPWDWDHIYPNSWVYNMKNCKQIIRDWNGANGNFRAISLEQNRSESNNTSPQSRLEDLKNREYSFVFENDWECWQKIDDRIWNEDKAKNHFHAVTTRMVNIYEKFWNDLKLSELIVLKTE